LDGSPDRAGEYCDVKSQWLTPLVKDFVAEIVDFLGVEGMLASDIFVVGRILGNEGSLLQERKMVHEAFLLGKGLNISKQNCVGNA
jgi:hypothetical protein